MKSFQDSNVALLGNIKAPVRRNEDIDYMVAVEWEISLYNETNLLSTNVYYYQVLRLKDDIFFQKIDHVNLHVKKMNYFASLCNDYPNTNRVVYQ